MSQPSQPVVVSIPHRLGKEEALRRLQAGFEKIVGTIGAVATVSRQEWTGDHLDFSVGVLGQTATGGVDVTDDQVRLEILLPGMLGMLADKARDLIAKGGQVLLEKK